MDLRRAQFSVTSLFGVLAAFVSSTAAAKPYVESSGRLEIDWSTHRIRFYGESKLPAEARSNESLRSVEQAAWQEGLNYVSKAVRDYHVSVFSSAAESSEALAKQAKEAAQAVTKSTTSRKTVYYSDGTVRVILENPLSKALASDGLRFRQKEAMAPSAARYTGVVFELDRRTKPKPVYNVVDETGAVLFHAEDMAEQSYNRHLMGHWFIKPATKELSASVGESPLRVIAKVDEKGRFVVSRSLWQDVLVGHRSLLVSGRIAISLPESQ